MNVVVTMKLTVYCLDSWFVSPKQSCTEPLSHFYELQSYLVQAISTSPVDILNIFFHADWFLGVMFSLVYVCCGSILPRLMVVRLAQLVNHRLSALSLGFDCRCPHLGWPWSPSLTEILFRGLRCPPGFPPRIQTTHSQRRRSKQTVQTMKIVLCICLLTL